MSTPTPIITKPPTKENRVAENDTLDPPVTVQQVNVKWWKKWSTHLATLNATTLVATFALLPERIQEAFPQWSLIALGGAVLASVLIPAATSIKQARKVE